MKKILKGLALAVTLYPVYKNLSSTQEDLKEAVLTCAGEKRDVSRAGRIGNRIIQNILENVIHYLRTML